MAEKCWAHYESARAEYIVSQNELEGCWAEWIEAKHGLAPSRLALGLSRALMVKLALLVGFQVDLGTFESFSDSQALTWTRNAKN